MTRPGRVADSGIKVPTGGRVHSGHVRTVLRWSSVTSVSPVPEPGDVDPTMHPAGIRGEAIGASARSVEEELCPTEGSVVHAHWRFAAPALVLLAALSILQGYGWLHLVSNDSFHPPALVFVAVVFPLALFLTRPARGARRSLTEGLVALAAWLLLACSLLVSVVDRPPVDDVVGACDLLVALAAIVMVASSEWRAG